MRVQMRGEDFGAIDFARYPPHHQMFKARKATSPPQFGRPLIISAGDLRQLLGHELMWTRHVFLSLAALAGCETPTHS